MPDERGAYFYVCGLVIWVGEAYVCSFAGVLVLHAGRSDGNFCGSGLAAG